MTENEHDASATPDGDTVVHETLPEQSPTAGETALRKGDVETDEPKAGKGGDHPTPGAGEHDDPSN
jgi:hypothetical protein